MAAVGCVGSCDDGARVADGYDGNAWWDRAGDPNDVTA